MLYCNLDDIGMDRQIPRPVKLCFDALRSVPAQRAARPLKPFKSVSDIRNLDRPRYYPSGSSCDDHVEGSR